MIATVSVRYRGFGTRMLSVTGDGPPIILLHGYSDSADTWRSVLTGLAEAGQRAVAVDLPGFGAADRRRPGPLVEQFDEFADALIAEHGPAVLVGNSLGAATAVRAATRHRDSVLGVVALNDPLNARHLPARLARQRVPPWVWTAAGMIPLPESALNWALAWALPRVLYGPGSAVDPAVLCRWQSTIAGPGGLARLGRYAAQYAQETANGHRDEQVHCPTLIVHGGKDRIIPVSASRDLHKQIPGSHFMVLPGSGHCPQLDSPEEVVRLVLGLRNRVASASERTS